MGLCLGTDLTEEDKKAKIHSSQIDRDLYEYAKREMNVVKILMLGKKTLILDVCSPGLSFGFNLYHYLHRLSLLYNN